MLIVGPQLRAGRALLGIGQAKLAEAAGVALNTVRRIEAQEGRIVASTSTVHSLQRALEAEGVEFTNGDAPGVRLRRRAAA